ncbi:MAG: hypothetical protein QM537_07350 [Candidatus Symbiobacter sp.]|nr:hypothetical protein [Candidatus Symbiobacter sp.]
MTKRSILFALFGGVAAGLCSLPPDNDRVVVGHFILMTLAALPIFLAGLSGGIRSAVLTAFLATSISTSLGGIGGIFFGLLMAIPAAMLASIAVMPINFWRKPNLSFFKTLRPSRIRNLFGKNGDDYIEVPSGSILLLCLVWAGWTVFLTASYFTLSGQANPDAALKDAMNAVLPPSSFAALSSSDQVTIGWVLQILARFPSILVEGWMMCLLLNGILAQGLLMRFNYHLRTPPDIGNIVFPVWFSLMGLGLLGISLCAEADWFGPDMLKNLADRLHFITLPEGVLTMLPWVGYIARNLLLLQMTGFFFAGLAVIHCLARKRPYRILLLSVYYGLALMVPWVMLMTNIIGLIEPWTKLRRRFV